MLTKRNFFERTFDGETEGRRLDRLDTFIFGTTNHGSAQVRITLIAKVVPVNTPVPDNSTTNAGTQGGSGKTGPGNAGGGNAGAGNSPSASGSANSRQGQPANSSASAEPTLESPGNYPHITAMEAKILGETYPNDSLNQRLSRLETKVFGSPSKSNDFEERTDALDRHMQAQRKPKDLLIGTRPDEDDMPEVIPTSLERERRYESADEDAGSVIRHQTIEQELADAQKSTPPTRDERTLSRIAWCEQQVFGHAFPEMHLLKRLHQLNHELFPQDKEPDIQLMDRIDTIVKEVVLKKQPHQPTQA